MKPTAKTIKQEGPAIEKLRKAPLRFVCSWGGDIRRYFPMHFHRVIELVYHPRGAGVTALGNGRKIEFEPRGIVIYPAGLRHDQRMHSPGTDICIHVTPSTDSPAIASLFSEALYIPPTKQAERQSDRYVHTEFLSLVTARPDPSRQVELDLRVTALISRLLHLKQAHAEEIPKTPIQIYLDRARQFIQENYAQISSIGAIAEYVGVSEDYLRHVFLEEGGTSLSQLVIQTRIERAKELLIHSRLPIKEIASLSGFKTERYLSTRFKKLTHLSPGAFRRQSMNAK